MDWSNSTVWLVLAGVLVAAAARGDEPDLRQKLTDAELRLLRAQAERETLRQEASLLAGRKANLVAAPAPDTDMVSTHADISKARRLLGYEPKTSVPEGVRRLWEWYRREILSES